jgi:CRP/FNR family transcriptional regulator, cyclic AMP receptor protein
MDKNPTKGEIDRISFLDQLTLEELALFQQHGTMLTMKKNEPLDLDDPSHKNSVFLVTQGFVKLTTLNLEGKKFSLSLLQTGDLSDWFYTKVGEEKPFLQSGNCKFLESITGVSQVLRINETVFQGVLDKKPSLYVTLLRVMQCRVYTVQRQLSDVVFKDVHARIAQTLLDMVFHYAELCPYAFGVVRDVCLTHQEISELIGASRPVTSLALNDFARADLVHKHDRFLCLQNIPGLEVVAQEGYQALKKMSGSLVVS